MNKVYTMVVQKEICHKNVGSNLSLFHLPENNIFWVITTHTIIIFSPSSPSSYLLVKFGCYGIKFVSISNRTAKVSYEN